MTAPALAAAPPGRTRRRLSRTLTRNRWPEYRRLLDAAIGAGYDIVSLESFIAADGERRSPTLILRHDVDQAPGSVAPMLDAERERGLTATWYFRWRTARPDVVESVRESGGEVGLHYETLTRQALARAAGTDAPPVDLDDGRQILKAEILAFAQRFGPVRSVAAHGDTRAPGVRNADLLRDQEPADFGIAFDANDVMRRHRLACWLTDRSKAEGLWKDGLDPLALFAQEASPILCLTHPNNWISGVRLWGARAALALRRDGDQPLL